MPRSSTGKWVARAAATGGGRTYRGQVPMNWYAALVLIVIVGLLSVVFSRMDYQNGAAANTIPPLKGGTPWFAGIAFDVCGKQLTPLPADALNTTKQSFYTSGNGVITIAPKTTTDAGNNAVLGKFISSYKGLTLTSTELQLPSTMTSKSSKRAKSPSTTTYRNGQKCPAGTKDAGKAGVVTVTYWKSAFASNAKPSTVVGNPGILLFTNNQLITVGFVPSGTKLPKPNGKIVTALLDASTGASSTTTTTAPTSTTSTSAPASTSTTTSSSSTTTSTTKAG
ncbi:MAG TPA: hypothetical protein VKR78_03440 [Acidimicrobiales bacterium]|jgi:hypothetical protein|nr:hypothetical protein [Acidimicrobiales bacterium]